MGKIAVLAAVAFALTACQSTSGGKGGAFCDIARPSRLSAAAIAAMSDAEVAEALSHNRTGARLCGWKTTV